MPVFTETVKLRRCQGAFRDRVVLQLVLVAWGLQVPQHHQARPLAANPCFSGIALHLWIKIFLSQ